MLGRKKFVNCRRLFFSQSTLSSFRIYKSRGVGLKFRFRQFTVSDLTNFKNQYIHIRTQHVKRERRSGSIYLKLFEPRLKNVSICNFAISTVKKLWQIIEPLLRDARAEISFRVCAQHRLRPESPSRFDKQRSTVLLWFQLRHEFSLLAVCYAILHVGYAFISHDYVATRVFRTYGFGFGHTHRSL